MAAEDLNTDQVLLLYQKVLEGKTLEIISEELNISLDIVVAWRNEHAAEIEQEKKKIKEAAKTQREKDEDDLAIMEEQLGRIDIGKIK
ncbi:MAG: hypothetical protein GY754_39210 [bacterium]|nr:hypothetical protein [bacterium]